jgi:hypothetical protein
VARVGFMDSGSGVTAREGEDERVIVVVTSDGRNEETVMVRYSFTSRTAQGN